MASGRPTFCLKRSGAAVLREFVHDRLGAGVLPDDGVVDRLAGGLVPHHRGFALVGDADGGDVVPGQVRLGQGRADHLAGVVPDLGGVVLHPAGLREDLLVLHLAGGDDAAAVVEDDGAGARGALVDGDYVLVHVDVLVCLAWQLNWRLSGAVSDGMTGTMIGTTAGHEAAEAAADERADDRDPGVAPVAGALALDGEQGVRDARAEVTGGVDGVAGGATEGDTDADNQQGHGQRAEAGRRPAEGQDDEDQHEGADDLGDQVPPVGADRRAGGEDGQLAGGLRLDVEVLLVGQPHDHGAEEGTGQFTAEVGQGRGEVDRNAGSVQLLAVDQQAKSHGRVQVRTETGSNIDTGEDGNAPSPGDHQEPAVVALGAFERNVGHHAATQQGQHCGTEYFGQENYSKRHL